MCERGDPIEHLNAPAIFNLSLTNCSTNKFGNNEEQGEYFINNCIFFLSEVTAFGILPTMKKKKKCLHKVLLHFAGDSVDEQTIVWVSVHTSAKKSSSN